MLAHYVERNLDHQYTGIFSGNRAAFPGFCKGVLSDFSELERPSESSLIHVAHPQVTCSAGLHPEASSHSSRNLHFDSLLEGPLELTTLQRPILLEDLMLKMVLRSTMLLVHIKVNYENKLAQGEFPQPLSVAVYSSPAESPTLLS